MQKWYDDGYFSADLPMKRVLYDAGWITVGELGKLAAHDKIFLSPLRHAGPPGLTKRESPPLNSVSQQSGDNVFNNPYQPAPVRSLRSSTLDSYTGSNPSDSPSSSLGHFGNNSPDPLAFGGLAGNGHGFIAGEGAGMHGIGGGMDLNGMRRSHLHDYSEPHRLHSPSYGNILGNPAFANNGHGFPSPFNTVQSSPWGTPSHDAYGGYNNGAYNPTAYAPHSPFNGQLPNQVIGGQINPLLYGGNDMNSFNGHLGGMGNNDSPFGNAPQAYGVEHQYSQQQQQQPRAPSTEAKIQQSDYSLHQANQGNASDPWGSSSVHPAPLNTAVPAASSQSSPWGQPIEPPQPIVQPTQSAVPQDASPWVLASHGVLETPWAAPTEPVSNASKLDKLEEEPVVPLEESTAVADVPVPAPTVSPLTEAPAAPAPKSGKKAKAAASAPAPPLAAPAAAPAPADPAAPSAAPGTPTLKAPWAKDEKKKAKAAGTAVSLREIQDAEAKAAEARKAKEEKERALRLASSTPLDVKEDVQPFTASWGLPTSQAGGRASSYAKDAPAAAVPAAPSAPPVWTNTAKAPIVKKTMKEIQEEEERRKKAAAKETVTAAAAKRAYAESTAKVREYLASHSEPDISHFLSSQTAPSAAPASNSAWVTVGSSGKTGATVAAPARPTLASVASSASATRTNGPSAARPTVQTSSSKQFESAATNGRVEDFPATASREFATWLNESLKGLNSSVNGKPFSLHPVFMQLIMLCHLVGEIVQMFMSFSLDPDPTTIEIIQETIYANSTTLDGRRFAAEFVAKRKADALRNKSGGASGNASSKTISIADVVKSTPKSSQPEWGFKVVNKKKKGGRA